MEFPHAMTLSFPMVWLGGMYLFVAPFCQMLLFGILHVMAEPTRAPRAPYLRSGLHDYGALLRICLLRCALYMGPIVLVDIYLHYLASVPAWNIIYQNADTIAEQNGILAMLLFLFLYPFVVGYTVTLLSMTEMFVVFEKLSVFTALGCSWRGTPKFLGLFLGMFLLVVSYGLLMTLAPLASSGVLAEILSHPRTFMVLLSAFVVFNIWSNILRVYLYRRRHEWMLKGRSSYSK